MPAESRYYRFEDGLVLTTVDGRKHRIATTDFQARPDEGSKSPAATESRPDIRKPAYYAPTSTINFQEREIHFGLRCSVCLHRKPRSSR